MTPAYGSFGWHVIESTFVKLIIWIFNQSRTVKFLQNGHKSAAIPAVRHSTTVIAFPRQVPKCLVMNCLEKCLKETGRNALQKV